MNSKMHGCVREAERLSVKNSRDPQAQASAVKIRGSESTEPTPAELYGCLCHRSALSIETSHASDFFYLENDA